MSHLTSILTETDQEIEALRWAEGLGSRLKAKKQRAAGKRGRQTLRLQAKGKRHERE